MSPDPRVSCVVIFLDGELFLDEAIRSVVDQTFPDWELLLVDDGSTDRSSFIARRWALTDPRIRYLEHPGRENRGMSASRNLGLRHARGEYVNFLDCDDVLLPTKFATQVSLLDERPDVHATYGPTQLWHGWTGLPQDRAHDLVSRSWVEPGRVMEPGDLLALYRRTAGASVPAICSILARRSAVVDVGGFEDSFRGSFEDQVFYARMGLHLRVLITGDALDRYRQHADSCCARNEADLTYHPTLLNPTEHRYLLWLEAYLEAQGIVAGEIWDSVQEALHPYRHRWSRVALADRKLRARILLKRTARRTIPALLWQFGKAVLGRGPALTAPVTLVPPVSDDAVPNDRDLAIQTG